MNSFNPPTRASQVRINRSNDEMEGESAEADNQREDQEDNLHHTNESILINKVNEMQIKTSSFEN